MKGDFSRLSFDRGKRYTSVLLQQGRVTLDSDWNEQAFIRERHERSRFRDIVGSSASPSEAGFALRDDGRGLRLTAGRTYAGGLACELDSDVPLEQLLGRPLTPARGATYLVYVDAWERHLTAVDDPEILEVALGGADTTTRLEVAWRIGLVEDVGNVPAEQAAALLPRQPDGVMSAAAPDGYRGAENQLYRIEIHAGGERGAATFKWSRDNGSAAFAVSEFLTGMKLRLAPSTAATPSLAAGDWVEVSGEESEFTGAVGTVARVRELHDGITVELDRDVSVHSSERHPRLRRWDQTSGPLVPVGTEWLELENGVEIRFSDGGYRSGDYWTIPARTVNASIEWPQDRTPDGIEHRFAPLALVTWDRAGSTRPRIEDCRRVFMPLTELQQELAHLRQEVAELRKRRANS
jgi:hypothetical protein